MRAFLPFVLLLILAGCTVGPNYQRPKVTVPGDYRNQSADQPATAESLGDEKWWTVFHDEELQKLIRTALQQNYDVRTAAARILQAQAQLTITRSGQFPTFSGQAGFTSERIPGFGISADILALEGAGSWTPDFWGQYRRATEAARANLLATEWSRRQVLSTVVETVATAYFELGELDLELQIARRTLASRQESLKLTQTLSNGGAVPLLDVRQAEQLVETAASVIPDTERQISQQEDLLSTLLGENPHDIPRGLKLTEEPVPATVPAGLPSKLLERRPDIRQAEQQLVSANAEIGVARAQLFPSLPLTGSGGIASTSLASLFSTGAGVWNFSAPITQPFFNAGRLRANVRYSEAVQQQYVLNYRQVIQQAFRQVSDSLTALTKYRQTREHQELLTAAAQDAVRLSDLRYRGGVTSYLESLTNETNYFAAQLNLARAQLQERLSLVQVYTALGGGWQS
ncbi:MAG: efflux transporter outer membrane subunit [Acidobacteriota bacterium]|nr:efflux transporter outer membrane subunit [Acidobacteriota bacterium]